MDLPLDRFISVAETGDLRNLIIEGDCTPLVLSEAWLTIFLEYLDSLADTKVRYRVDLISRIAILEARVTKVDACLYVLQLYPGIREIEQELVHLFETDPTHDSQEAYAGWLNDCRARAQEIVIDLKLARLELEELDESEEKEEKEQKVTKTFFVNILARIATFRHVAVIRTSELTTREFCAAFKEVIEYHQAQQKNHQNPPPNG